MFLFQSNSLAVVYKEPNPLPALIAVVVESILEVFFLCLVGWILARKGIVDDKAKKILNKLNVSLFTPALLFSKVAFSLTPEKLADLYIIPVGFVIISTFSAAVAWGMGKVFRLKKSQRNFAIACTMFQNSNSLPIALMQSLIGEHMPLSWGPKDNKDSQLGRALSYLVLFSTLGIIVRWSIGVRLLTSAEAQDDDSPTSSDPFADPQAEEEASYYLDNSARSRSENQPLIEGAGVRRGGLKGGNGVENGIEGDGARGYALRHKGSGSEASSATISGGGGLLVRESEEQEDDTAALKAQKRKQRGRIFQSFPNTPIPSQYGGSEPEDSEDEEEDEGEDEEWGAQRGVGRRFVDGVEASRAWRLGVRAVRPLRRVGRKVGAFMTVPLWAALLSLVVACIPPLQHVLNEAEPLKAAIKNAGNCSVPITLVTLGAYFYRPSPPSPPRPLLSRLNPFAKSSSPSTGQPGETRTVLVTVVSRMVIVPMCLLPLFGWWAAKTVNVADDPVFVVVACLLIGSPTAITLAQITSSAAGDTFEKLISRTLFVSYAIMTAPCTIALVVAALFIDKFQ
ncbi:membrane transport protein-domain-containing protein [Leucosporidium creatinivorum]|uniref:Membrane transport protein-domain-containing protein n=1 Tax=Leucosporidium creatinivorum TaxID=106004 RepID=A0A1Y2G4L9_9BASI|nr:membrane transport protein-domain-containing protein [Leucosporidium creatinivorum]